MRDFTTSSYKALLESLKSNYIFISYTDYCLNKEIYDNQSNNIVILRHDVDIDAEKSLAIAQIEHSLGIVATYYFRIVPQSNKKDIILKIADLGHEIGYHYEDLTFAQGDVDNAFEMFKSNLKYFRTLYPVSTICMHGSPRSPWDSKDIWKKYSYKDLGIVGEPYFTTEFGRFFYITDTGRCWDGYNVSRRDKIPVYQDIWIKEGLVFHSTSDIIKSILERKFPSHVMITTHPQRWIDGYFGWIREFFMQKIKNIVKYIYNRTK